VAHRLRLTCARIVERDADAKIRAYGIRLKSLRKHNLAQPAINVIVNHVAEARLKGGFLLAASDASQVYLYVVSDQSAARHDDPGFAAVGSGSMFGLPVLAARRIHKGIELELAVYAAYQDDSHLSFLSRTATFRFEKVKLDNEALFRKHHKIRKEQERERSKGI
jgi:hypothetical protein